MQGGSSSPASTRASAPAIDERSPHDTHTTLNMDPCTSITRSTGVPAFWCSPSMFCVTIWVSMREPASSASAACAAFGSAVHAGLLRRACHDRRRTAGSLT